MFKNKHLVVVLLGVTMIAATSAQGFIDNLFEGTQDDNWANPNNWSEGAVPGDIDLQGGSTFVGDFFSGNQTARVYAGTHVTYTGGLEVGSFANASLTIDANASITNNIGWSYIGQDGGNAFTTTMTVNGSYSAMGTQGMFVGDGATTELYVNAGGILTVGNVLFIGQDYHFAGSRGADTYIEQTGGTISVGNGIQMASRNGHTVRYKMSGGTISTGSFYARFSTFEVAGAVNITGALQILSGTGPQSTLKFSGTDPLATIGSGLNYGNPTGNLNSLLDLSELTVSTPNTWVTVAQAAYMLSPENLVLSPNTDANVWSFRANDGGSGLLEVFYSGAPSYQMGDSSLDGYVDDADLSLLLANWHNTTDWGHGNLSDDDPFGGTLGFVDDADLSLLLANWHAGTPPPMAGGSVPEPATMLMLAIGAAGALIRRKR